MKPVLNIQNLNYSYHSKSGEVPALKDICLSVYPGEFISVVGPSGCGKSTLLSLIAGLIKPDSGTIEYNGYNNIGYMLQKDNLFEWRSVYSNIMLGLEIQKKTGKEYTEPVDKMIDTYGLNSFKEKRPSELSGGMRQRAALIRTLALSPDILLLDEPFSALDYQTRLEVSEDIGNIIKKEGKTAILVTHDLSEAISMGDRVAVLSKRPATIKCIVPVEFSTPHRTPITSRNAPEFPKIFNTIWKELSK